MEHQLWPILQKPFICDKTRQCFIWSLIQSYVYRLYPFLCISTLSSPMYIDFIPAPGGGGALGYFLGGYVPHGTPNWLPVLKTNSPKIDTLF